MFRKKGKQDAIHQANIKRGITSHFARTLKALQQRHLHSDADEYIYSDDYSNNLCSALEAVFLYGLKDSVTQKMSTYVGLATPQDQSPYLNFWSICAKFTHKDVITQLRGLSQINTEIGLCRAWIRLALNDGLMESYLHSMLVDKKTMVYYYHSYSYLRDHEQPGILKNFLTGLMSLCFKLSFNSSVLNSWNNTSLQLAGLLDGSHVPGATLTMRDNAPNLAQVAERGEAESESKKYSEGAFQEESIVANKRTLQSSQQSRFPSNDGKQPMFSSIQDVEEIRRIAIAQNRDGPLSFSLSDGSSSSLVSCPDPSSLTVRREEYNRQEQEGNFIVSPSLYPRADAGSVSLSSTTLDEVPEVVSINEVMSGISDVSCDLTISGETDLEQSQKSTSTVVVGSTGDEVDSSIPVRRPRSRRVTDDEELNLSPKSLALSLSPSRAIHEDNPIYDTENTKAFKPSPSPSLSSKENTESDPRPETSERSASPSSNAGKGDASAPASGNIISKASPNRPSQPYARGRTYDEICATLPPLKLDPAEQEAILKKVLGEFDEKADKERAERHRNELQESPQLNRRQDPEPKGNGGNSVNASTPLTNSFSEKTVASLKTNNNKHESSEKVDQSSDNGHSMQKVTSSSDITQTKAEPSVASAISKTAQNLGDGPLPNVNQSSDSDTNLKKEVADTVPPSEVVSDQQCENQRLGDHSMDGVSPESPQFLNSMEESSSSDTGQFHKSSSFGNSLNNMQGWSSEIENSQEERKRTRERSRGESFASMLRSYAGQNKVVGKTLDQVLEGLPSDDDDEEEEDQDNFNQPSEEAAGDRDSDLDEFEVLSPLPSTAQGLQEVDTSRMIYLFRVPREHGLSHQNFTCRGCSRPIGIIYGQPRLCEFDGGLYCFECHQNNETQVPSSIVYNWDFSKKKVCMENFKFLQELENQALYDVDELNPRLDGHVPELKALKTLRKQLRYLKSYLFSCSQKMAESLRQKVWPREHLYDQCTTYSVSDFFQVQSGALQRFVKDLVKFASKHVYECSLCCQKGFICEICRNARIIYPFEVETTIRCEKCKSVFHQACMTDDLPCPKCERWGRRFSKDRMFEDPDNDVGHPEDYGMSPPVI